MKKIIFVTSKYPFGNGETFIENEIEYLAKAFDKVYIYATEAQETDVKRNVPENVIVFPANPNPVSKKDYIPCLFNPSVLKEMFSSCFFGYIFAKVSALCYFFACFKSSAKRIPEFLKTVNITPDDTITVYSYWLSTIGMCALEIKDSLRKSEINPKIVSRCHGFDIYKERSYLGYQPFQQNMISQFDNIFPCSKNGQGYLKALYPQYSERIRVSYLGVKDCFKSDLPKKEDVFRIVSCSNVIPIKRVDLIISALSKITDKKISWTHFGDGEDFENIKTLAKNVLPDNVSCDFKGRIPNSEIYNFYNDNNVNLFINVSESEGLPVSIMEAISFGIPIIATNVGGTSEIVCDGENGFLLKKDFEISELAEKIRLFINFMEPEYFAFCKNSRNAFVEHFNANRNYSDFCELL